MNILFRSLKLKFKENRKDFKINTYKYNILLQLF